MTLVGFVPDLGSTPKVGVFIFRDPRELRVAVLRFDDLGDPKVNEVSKGPSTDLRLKNLAFLCFSFAFPLLFLAFPLLFLCFSCFSFPFASRPRLENVGFTGARPPRNY